MKEIVAKLIDVLHGREKELGFDWRSSWFKVMPGADGSVTVAHSRSELGEGIEVLIPGSRVEESGDGRSLCSDDGHRIRFELAGSKSGTSLLAVSSVADLRREPEHSSELISQAIMGETMVCLEERGDWYFVRMEDDYHGWVRSWSVRETSISNIDRFRASVNAMVRASVGYVLAKPEPGSIPLSDVTAGTLLAAGEQTGGYTSVRLPGGKEGFIAADNLCSIPAGKTDGKRITDLAKHFLGIPYIWGGTSAKGFDCSGLVKRVFSMEGVSMPRDADQQSERGALIPLDDIGSAEKADLLYFGEGGKITHVAIALGEGKFIHAYGDVRINSFVETDSLFEEKLAVKLLFGRSIL